MNLYRLELKRVCKTRMTAILLAIALVLAVVMAYLPVTFIGWTELDASGNEVRYTGLKAIRKRQEQQVSGTITPDVMQEALETYQRVYRQYDASSINDIPVEVFYKELARYQPLVNNAKEAFADLKTGMAPGVMGLTAEDMQNFYSQLPKRLESVIWLEQSGKPGYEQAQAIAQKKFDAVQKPFTYSFGVSSDAMDYQTLLSLLLTLLCAVIAAPVFASDAQTGAQDIQLCTKNGGLRLAAAKLAAAFSITGAAYLLCGVVWILVTNALFGWESTQTSDTFCQGCLRTFFAVIQNQTLDFVAHGFFARFTEMDFDAVGGLSDFLYHYRWRGFLYGQRGSGCGGAAVAGVVVHRLSFP